jgi:hypothetical protein
MPLQLPFVTPTWTWLLRAASQAGWGELNRSIAADCTRGGTAGGVGGRARHPAQHDRRSLPSRAPFRLASNTRFVCAAMQRSAPSA